MKNLAILASWKVYSKEGVYYIAQTQYVYLKYLASKYRKIYLISPHYNLDHHKIKNLDKSILNIDNVSLLSLPSYYSYAGAMKYFPAFIKQVLKVRDKVDVFYTVSPDPFCWLPCLLCFKKQRIIHYVADMVSVTLGNVKWSLFRKTAMITCYAPEYILTLLASKFSHVFTNGKHLASKLKRFGVKSNCVISSTVTEDELPLKFHDLQEKKVRITYIGALRYSKGIDVIMRLLLLLEETNIDYHFNIVGTGDMLETLKNFIANNDLLRSVTLHGNINERKHLLDILSKTDLFYFPSLSEGSPRVVIEAMSQGVPVISTPVGSLPYSFKDYTDIRFFDFNSEKESLSLIKEYFYNKENFNKMRENAFLIVKERYTIDAFLSEVFLLNK